MSGTTIRSNKSKGSCVDCGCLSTDFIELDSDLCFVDGSVMDRTIGGGTSYEVCRSVWQNVKPPPEVCGSLLGTPPMISARKLDVTRAQLDGKLKKGSERVGEKCKQ